MSQEQGVCSAFVTNKDTMKRGFAGELIGTFIMCFLGIGAVATATLYGALTSALHVGLVWGIAIALGIYTTRNFSCAHFNPAVTFAMCLSKRCSWKHFPVYLAGQVLGAMLAAACLWLLYKDSVMLSLVHAGIDMTQAGAASSIWIEQFPNTANGVVTPLVGSFAEAIGVFILVIVIFSMTEGCNLGRPSDDLFPLFIGLTVTCLICLIGPMTDAGFNPARAMGPRIIGALVGWHSIAFSWDAVLVYVVGPMAGAALASIFFVKILEPLQKSPRQCKC